MLDVIVGIDPGSLKTGYACIAQVQGQVKLLDQGVFFLKPPSLKKGFLVSSSSNFAQRMNILSQHLQNLFKRHSPHVVVVEKIFLARNVDSAFKLGHARGVCLQKIAEFNAQCVEMSSRQVKKNITGHGGASKAQVELLLRRQFQLTQPLLEDAADALALAMTYLQKSSTVGLQRLGARL